MTGNTLADAQRMFKHACAFAGCARFCSREPWNMECRLPDYSVAEIVNSAFACEVFIKSLLVNQGVPIADIKEHKIADLWKMLEDKNGDITSLVKKRICELFRLKYNEKFYEMLDNVSNAFIDWRYIYEKSSGKIHITFLSLFRETLKGACCEVLYNMTWAEFTRERSDGKIGRFMPFY